MLFFFNFKYFINLLFFLIGGKRSDAPPDGKRLPLHVCCRPFKENTLFLKVWFELVLYGLLVLQFRPFIFLEPLYWFASWQDLVWVRNHVMAPLSEEWVFRACMTPLLLQCLEPMTAVFVGPVLFGIGNYLLALLLLGICSLLYLYMYICYIYICYIWLYRRHNRLCFIRYNTSVPSLNVLCVCLWILVKSPAT